MHDRINKVYIVDKYVRWPDGTMQLTWRRIYEKIGQARAQRTRLATKWQLDSARAARYGYVPPNPIEVDAYAVTPNGYEAI